MNDYFKDYKTIETWRVTVFDKTKKPYYLQSFAEEVEDILYGKQDPVYNFETREEAESKGERCHLAHVFSTVRK